MVRALHISYVRLWARIPGPLKQAGVQPVPAGATGGLTASGVLSAPGPADPRLLQDCQDMVRTTANFFMASERRDLVLYVFSARNRRSCATETIRRSSSGRYVMRYVTPVACLRLSVPIHLYPDC
jgi:hypothetical protein